MTSLKLKIRKWKEHLDSDSVYIPLQDNPNRNDDTPIQPSFKSVRRRKSVIKWTFPAIFSFLVILIIVLSLRRFPEAHKSQSLDAIIGAVQSIIRLPRPNSQQVIEFSKPSGYGMELILDDEKLLVATTNGEVTGGVSLFDVLGNQEVDNIRLGRTKYIASVSFGQGNSTILLAHSNQQNRFHVFDASSKGFASVSPGSPKLADGDISAVCGGVDRHGERFLLEFMKGGMVHIFIVRQNSDKRNEHIEFVKFRSFRFPLQSPYESAKACSVDPDLSSSFYVSTDLGHFYYLSFPSPTSDAVVRNIFSTSTLSLTSPPLTHSKISGTNKIGHSLRSFVQIRETKTQSLITILNVDSKHGNFVVIYRDIETGDWKFLSVINLPDVSGKIDSLQILSLPKPVSSFSSGIFALVAKNKEMKARDYKLYDLRYILSALTTNLVFSSLQNSVMSPYSVEHRNVGPYVCDDDPEDDDDFCSWNGYCNRGKCSCFSGFGGKECDKFNCDAVDKCGEAEGRGHCVGANKCKCNSPFYGDSCSHISVPSNVSLIPSELSKNSAIDNDDPEVYIHPTDPNYSVILGTTKSKLDGGIHVWDVEGKELWFQPVGNGSGVNSVDVIYDIVIEGTNEKVDVAIGGIRGKTNGVGIWQIIPAAIETNSRTPSSANTSSYIPILAPLQVHEFDDNILEIYGSCIYSPLSSSNKYVFITTKKGRIFQFQLTVQKSGKGFVSTLYPARNFTVGMGSQLENCVADSENEILFIGEESVGIWSYGANPTDTVALSSALPLGSKTLPSLIDATSHVDSTGHLTRDVEGISLYIPIKRNNSRDSKTSGYIVASSQGSNTYNIYDRNYPWKFLTSIRIGGVIDPATGQYLDEVTRTDSLVATSASIGRFTEGIFVVHDDVNSGQNIKDVDFKNKTVDEFENGLDMNGKVLKAKEYASFKVISWAAIREIVKSATKGKVDLKL